MILNYNETLILHHNGNLAVSDFLQTYHDLLVNLKSSFKGRMKDYCSTSVHLSAMKDFAIESGGFRCVELLAEYEKSSSIGDTVSCKALENKILFELDSFKETWISMLS